MSQVTLTGRHRLTPRQRDTIAGYLFCFPWLLHFALLIAGAMIFSFGISLTETDLLTGVKYVGFQNYQNLFKDPFFLKSLVVTAYYTFLVVPLGVIVALVIALLLNQKVVAVGFWRLIYYLPSVVSGVAVAVLWTWVLNPRFGLINQGLMALGVQDPPKWMYSELWAVPGFILMGLWGAGGAMLLYLAGLQGIPTPLYEAADIDGANKVQKFFNITMPMLTPTIFFNTLMSIIGSFQVFTQVYVMTDGGPNNATLTMVLYLYHRGFINLRFGYASAIAWILFFIILIFTMMVIRSSDSWVYYEGELRK
jgi:multiple sugar transport system permease protein